MKKKRIRIHKKTLRSLNNPEYVYIWINPKDNSIAICACENGSRDAIRVNTNRDCEIYSMALFYELGRLNRDLFDDRTYRIDGSVKQGDRILVFSMYDAIAGTLTRSENNKEGQR